MADIESYVLARWPDLVRTLVATGCSPEDAERLAVVALARIWPRWGRTRRAHEDVDILVYRALVNEASADGHDLATVLRWGARLDEHQIGAVLDIDGEIVADARRIDADWSGLYSGIAPITTIREAVNRARRRRIMTAGGVAAALAAIVGLALVVPDDAPPKPRPDPPPENAIAMAWWSDDTLHLDRAEVDVPGLVSLAQAGSYPSYSAAYTDTRGQVVQVDPDGRQTRIGVVSVDATIVGSPDGRVAWVEANNGSERLVVWDATTTSEVATLTLDGEGSDALALDGDDVYFDGPEGTSRWRIGEPTAAAAPDGLLDVGDGVDLLTVPTRQPSFGGLDSFSVGRGNRAALAPDGSLAVSWVPRRPGATLLVPGTSSLSPLPLDLRPTDKVLDARFTTDGRIVLVMSRVVLLSIGSDDGSTTSGRSPYATLVTCDPVSGTCVDSLGRASFSGSASRPSPVTLPD